MGELAEWQEFIALKTTYQDTHDAMRASFSDPPQLGTCDEMHFEGSTMNDLIFDELFNSDHQTIEQLPEESLAGLPLQAPLSLSSSSSNSSNITPPLSASHQSTFAPLLAMPGFPTGQWDPLRKNPEGLRLSGPQSLIGLMPRNQQSYLPSNQQGHTPSSHHGLGIRLPTHVAGTFVGGVDIFPNDNYKMDPFNDMYGTEGIVNSFNGPAYSLTPCTTGGTDGDDEAARTDLCYAKELERCFRTRPDYTMSLKDIYAWVKENTSKAKDPTSKGWQNSVRHNLSMNKEGFEKVASSPGQSAKKGGAGLWRLTPFAVVHGVISTTRFRKQPTKRQVNQRNGHPAPKRQASGRKGGQATRDASVRNRIQHARSKQATSAPNHRLGYQQYKIESSPYSCASSASSPLFNAVSTPNPPFAHLYPQDMVRERSIPPTLISQAQPFAPTYSTSQGSVRPAIGQYELGHINPNAGLFRAYDTDNSSYLSVTTPELTDNSLESFYWAPSSREQSVQA